MNLYHERLRVTPWFFLISLLILPTVTLMFAPIHLALGISIALSVYIAVTIWLIWGAATIRITPTHLYAGHASIELEYLGKATALRETEAQKQRTHLLHAHAWLLLRGWIKPLVRVEINDKNDTHPYWLISSRTPETFVSVLKQACQEINSEQSSTSSQN